MVGASGASASGSRGKRRAIIIGGSMGGVFAARYLQRQGWEVDIFERSNVPLVGRGAGIVTHPELRKALVDIGRSAEEDLGIRFDWRHTFDRDGNIIATYLCPQICTSWNRLFEILNEVMPKARYHLDKDFVRLEQDSQSITAHFADGTSVTGDLLVGADGFRSQVRAVLLPKAQPVYAGYIGWRGLAPEGRFSEPIRKQVIETFSFYLPPGEQILGYPAAGPENDLRPGHRAWNIVWYRPTDRATLERYLTDAKGHTHSMSIPPPLIAPEVIAQMRDDAERLLPPQFREAIRVIDQPFFQPIYDFATPAMAVGRCCLIGDAAFVIRPHVGAGVVKVAQDAETMARCVGAAVDVAEGLKQYEAERHQFGLRLLRHVRRLGSYIRRGFDTPEQQARAMTFAEPQALMADTATLDFLRRPELVD